MKRSCPFVRCAVPEQDENLMLEKFDDYVQIVGSDKACDLFKKTSKLIIFWFSKNRKTYPLLKGIQTRSLWSLEPRLRGERQSFGEPYYTAWYMRRNEISFPILHTNGKDTHHLCAKLGDLFQFVVVGVLLACFPTAVTKYSLLKMRWTHYGKVAEI